jgi:NAD(P)-dependent dehydrogenase (short-subunit alcohol dehydrogenase family)
MNILVTGGASGLGEALTRKLASMPASRVFFTFHRSVENSRRLESSLGNVEGLRCDFTKLDDVKRLKDRMPAMDLDVLVNNAIAGLTRNHFHKIEPETFSASFIDNVLPTIRITQQAILLFRQKKGGRIVNILTSYLINRPPIGLSEYVANKAYLESLSKSWAVENAKFNITSNCVSPSIMRTGLTKDTDERVIEALIEEHPLRKLLTTDEVAAAVSSLITSSSHINGVNLAINAGADVI